MKVLFDQGTPVPLRKSLGEHSVETAYERGWQQLENGALIAAAQSAGFELLITTDQNLRYQKNLDGREIAILVLKSTSWPRLRAHLDVIVSLVEQASPGTYREVPIP